MHKTRTLYVGEPPLRTSSRDGGVDVARGDEQAERHPLRLRPALPRRVGAEPRVLAAPSCRARTRSSRCTCSTSAPKPLGRGVWVLDASDNNNFTPRLHIPLRYPRPASKFEARVFGPFLVIRSRKPTGTIREFLLQTQAVQLVGQSLLPRRLGHQPAHGRARAGTARPRRGRRALATLGFGLLRERLAVAGRVLERGEAGGRRAGRLAHRAAPARGRDGCRRAEERAVHEGAETFAAPVLAVHETIVRCSSARSEICSST